MHLNHLNLTVTDVPATVALLEAHFGMRRVPGYPATDGMSFLKDDAGFLLSLFRGRDVQYPKGFHVGFIRPSVEEVEAIHARLSAAGLAVPPLREEHGRVTFYFDSPGGFVIEVEAFR
ncbi:VOC family protein [Deinococcus hohokamensis]|uniref:VOC family protein n=1 Tax=Deinococcus hohokamensis TaxID=309883 RepID=A0ABV9I9H5_9DEIO